MLISMAEMCGHTNLESYWYTRGGTEQKANLDNFKVFISDVFISEVLFAMFIMCQQPFLVPYKD